MSLKGWLWCLGSLWSRNGNFIGKITATLHLSLLISCKILVHIKNTLPHYSHVLQNKSVSIRKWQNKEREQHSFGKSKILLGKIYKEQGNFMRHMDKRTAKTGITRGKYNLNLIIILKKSMTWLFGNQIYLEEKETRKFSWNSVKLF